jgi:ubiquitin
LDFISGVIKMGSRKIKKAFKKVTNFVDKKVVEPLERPVKSAVKAVVVKPVTAVAKVAEEVFEEVIEKPVKKVAAETFDVVMNTDKEERRAMLGDAPPAPEPEVTPEVTPETVPDEPTIVGRGRRRSKRSGQAGTIMEEYGVVTAKPISKAVERA